MKNKKIIFLLCVLLILLLILILLLNKKENNKRVLDNEIDYVKVNDYSLFYTLEACANKYFNYISLNDTNSLNKIVDKNYDLSYFISKYENMNIRVRASEIYRNNNYFYFKGTIIQQLLVGYNRLDDVYLLIKLDKNERFFNIGIISESEFQEVSNG